MRREFAEGRHDGEVALPRCARPDGGNPALPFVLLCGSVSVISDPQPVAHDEPSTRYSRGDQRRTRSPQGPLPDVPPWRRRLEPQETASGFTSSFAVGPSPRIWCGIPLAQLIRKDKDQRPPKGTGYPLEARGLQKRLGLCVRTSAGACIRTAPGAQLGLAQ